MKTIIDPQQHLVLVCPSGKSVLEDQTNKLQSVSRGATCAWLRYHNKEKPYPKSFRDYRLLANPTSVPLEDKIVTYKGNELKGITQIQDFGDYIRIFIGSRIVVDETTKFQIELDCLSRQQSKEVMEYFKAVADRLPTKDYPKSFLHNQLNTIDQISENCVLGAYLTGILKSFQNQRPATLLYPFGFNLSQKKAVETAFASQISVIQGPPGTGKTQTILNIIANLIHQGKSVAVVSGNNSATQNVYEKLEKCGLDFLAAPLGNMENVEAFFSVPQPSKTVPLEWSGDIEEPARSMGSIKDKLQSASQLLEKQIELVRLQEKLSQLQVEFEFFRSAFQQLSSNKLPIQERLRGWKSQRILMLLAELEILLNSPEKSFFFRRLILFFRYRIRNLPPKGEAISNYILSIQDRYYQNIINECEEQITRLKEEVKSKGLKSLMIEIQSASFDLIRTELVHRFATSTDRTFSASDLAFNFKSFSERFPVVLSTTNSLRSCIQKHYLFDYVIIDEASQVDLITASIAMSCAKNMVIVGDNLQLPHIVDSSIHEFHQTIRNQGLIDENYDYTQNNILASLEKVFRPGTIPKTLLREHYRCDPRIIRFCNEKFYNGELAIMTEGLKGTTPLKVFTTTEGNHERRVNGSKTNQRQVDVCKDEIIPELKYDPSKIGIITPYRAQANLFTTNIKTPAILSDTVHKFQGREKEAIVFSSVSSQPDSFNDDPNLINVAVSRAVSEFILLISKDFESLHGSNIGDLLRYIEYNGSSRAVKASKIISIFDCLYSEYSERLHPILQRVQPVSRYKSENLMHALLSKIIERDKFGPLNIKLHYPLSKLVPLDLAENAREQQFLLHPFTHVDFVLFNRLNKEPVLAIEVDGFQYHKNSYNGDDLTDQKQRDAMKETLTKRAGLKLLRFVTNESGEEALIRNELEVRCQKPFIAFDTAETNTPDAQ